ncbi:unnamed protein product [Candidula unifasciata]|uniref:Kinase n=1 Tax=Candidula unifasciata TaxID=100452 RepID=A0A8S3Z512_9EUPU|nr:unnamed protein product [Candidula unifasciata]
MATAEESPMKNQETARILTSRALRPFDHQVAGQSLILHYNKTTICKCLIQREYQFYQVMPELLRPFVPEYRGVIQLYIPDTACDDCPIDCSCSRLHTHGPSSPRLLVAATHDHCPATDQPKEGFRISQRRMKVLQKTSRISVGGNNQDNLYYFMLLEDLMSRYQNPCILDLKIGVRQHGDDAPPEKVAYQVNKCRTTTSASLGLRLCGMKRYDVVSDECETRDKMYGRQLNDEDFKSQIEQFLFSGQDLRVDLVGSILHQLTDLKNVIEQLDGYRFYSCSLLIIYEGSVEDPLEQQEDTRSSNVLHIREGSEDFQSQEGVDFKFNDDLKGLNNDISTGVIRNSEQENTDSCVCSNKTHNNLTGLCENRQLCNNKDNYCSCQCHRSFPEGTDPPGDTNNHRSRLEERLSKVDIRIVDFAHATFDGFLCDTVKHYGPDHGFLLGVNTLLEIFTELKERSV